MRFDNIIPLGDNCSISIILKKLGLRRCAFPFDWCSHIGSNPTFSNININISLLTELMITGDIERITDSLLSNHELVFPHESGSIQDITEKYKRRITRLYNEIKEHRTNLFILVTRGYKLEQNILLNLYELLMLYNTNNYIMFISGVNHDYTNKFKYIPYNINDGWKPDQTYFREHMKHYLENTITTLSTETAQTDILFITAFKDINRHLWRHYGRTNEEYFECFMRLANSIKYTLIVYVDNYIKDELISKYSFASNIIFRDMTTVDTFLNKYVSTDKAIMNSEIYKNKIPVDRKLNPEHCFSEYNLINHSKINFVKDSQIHYPNYEYYSWIDFGYVKNNDSIPRNINLSLIPKKITYHCIRQPTYRIDPNTMLRSHDIYITGSSFIVHSSLVCKFNELWENKIIEWQKINITDDDQSLILQIYYDNPELFNLIQNNSWFSLFNIIT